MIRGIGRTGRLVTSAALILFLAFVSLASGPETEIKVLATGLAAGILLDATVIRALLVPAVVSLFGRWNWWLPHDARAAAARRALAAAPARAQDRPGRGGMSAANGSRADNGIEVEGLIRDFKGGVRAVDGHRPAGRAGRDLRLPRAQRRGQVDDRAGAHDAATAHRGQGARGGAGRGARGRGGAPRDRRLASGVGAGPVPERARAHAPAERAARAQPGRRVRTARRRAARARWA